MRACNILAWLILALYVSLIFWLIYLYPPVHDTWGHVRPAPWYNRSIVEAFLFGFYQNNPRLGQAFLAVFGGQPIARAALGTFSFSFLAIGMFIVAVARLPRFTLCDAAILLWSISMIVMLGKMPGQMIFYIPFNANYVLGFAFLLAFIAPYRIDLFRHPLRNQVMILPVVVLGAAAGFSNEHTIPAVIAIWGAAIAFLAIYRRDKMKIWHLVGYVSLTTSYALLFFAPGQAVRYGDGTKSSGMEKFFVNLPNKIYQAIDYTLAGLWPILCLVAAVCLIVATLTKFRPSKSVILTCSICLLCAALIAVTSLASPFLVERLFFASQMMIAIALVALIGSTIYFSPKLGGALAIVGAMLPLTFYAEAIPAVNRYAEAFEARKKEAEIQIASGSDTVYLTLYDLKSIGPVSIIHNDEHPVASKATPHPALRRYLGAPKIEFRKPRLE